MKAETGEWVAKAEGDFHDAQRGIRARKNPNYDGVCFNTQQCIEKYLKGCLVEAGIRFPKIHNLARCSISSCPWSHSGRRGGPA